MGSTVLVLVSDFTEKMGLPTPSALVGATDKSTKQLRSVLRETIYDLGRYRWQQARIRTTFTSVNASLQGTLTVLFGTGYNGLVKDSMWNDTRNMRIFGPISDQAWQALQTLPNAGPEYSCWVSRDSLYISPTLPAGETISAVYITKYNVLSVDNVTYQERILNDGDKLVFPDDCVLRLMEAKWRKQKGESGWEDTYNDAMGLIAKSISQEGDTTLCLSTDDNRGARPGIIIPPGNWGV